jgi:ankyrin repeat protein
VIKVVILGLHEAAKCGQKEIVNCLIKEFNCNPISMGTKGKTILHLACNYGHAELVKTLLTQHKELLLCGDQRGNIPLHDAALDGQIEMLKIFFNYEYLRLYIVDFTNHSKKQTPLHFACAAGHLNITKVLISEYKADLNACDKNGDMPQHIAVISEHTKVILCLISEFSCNPRAKGKCGRTILHYACIQGHTELIQALVTQCGPNLLSISDDNGNTPMDYVSDKECELHTYIGAWCGLNTAINILISGLKNDPHINCKESLPKQSLAMTSTSRRSSMTCTLDHDSHTKSLAQSAYYGYSLSGAIHEDMSAGLLVLKYDLRKTSSSIIRIFIIENSYRLSVDFNPHNAVAPPLYEGVWYGNTQDIEPLISRFPSCPGITVGDGTGRSMLNLAIQVGYIELIRPLLRKYSTYISSADISGNTPLHYAAWSCRKDVVKLLSKYNCPANTQNKNNQTPLHLICIIGHANIARTLVIEFKADLCILDKDSNTPLHVAAWYGHTKIVKLFIDEFNCNPNAKGFEGRTILHQACHKGHVKLVKTLLTEYKLDTSCVDDNGCTPLHHAALGGSEQVVKVLITEYHCPVDSINNANETSLHLACAGGHLYAIRMLCSHNTSLLQCDSNNDTPLHKAAIYGQINIIEEFKWNSISSMKAKGYEGRTILHHACRHGHIELVNTLLNCLRRELLHPALSIDDHGNTALHLAAMSGRESVVDVLTNSFIDTGINYRNKSNQSPLDIACSSGYLNIVKKFVTNAKFDSSGDTILHTAASYGQINTIKYLVDNLDYKMYETGRVGMTVLHSACHGGQVELTEILLTEYKFEVLSRDKNENTPLHYAAMGGQENVVRLLITKYGCPVDCLNSNKETPLHLSCSIRNCHPTVVKLLVTEHNADLNAINEDGNTPLHKAAWCGHTDLVTLLIDEFGHNTNTKGARGANILHHACHQGHIKLTFSILDNVSFYKLDLLSVDNDGNTTLHHTALGGRSSLARVLITKYGCPVDCRNKYNQTPLHLACGNGHLNVVKTLENYKANLHTCDDKNDTPLHTAAYFEQIHIIIHLLNHGCNINAQGNKGRTILHHACYNGHAELVKRLLNRPKLDPFSVDGDGNTALHLAAMGGRENVMVLLIIKYHFLIDCRNIFKQSPLHLACNNGHILVVRTLLSRFTADLYLRDINNDTPLHMAVLHQQTDTINCLIAEFNCHTDIKGANGYSILHLACQQGLLELTIQLVTDYNHDPMTTDDNGNTPLHYAALGGKIEVATLLITKYGTPVNHLNNNNETPLHLACTKGHVAFIQTLVTELKADINICDINKNSPLQTAILSGQIRVVCSLISKFSCDPDVTGTQGRNLLHYACLNDHDELAWTLINTFNISLVSADVDGNSPLPISAMFGQNKCVQMLLRDYHAPIYLRNNSGRSALEVTRNTVTKNIIETYLREEHNRIQYDYKGIQTLSSKKYSGAQKLSRVFVLGNASSGKSTLIESLKREGFLSSRNQVSEATVPPHTSGIIPSEHRHKSIGRVLYYDFAGEPEYYSSHSAIMSSIMQAKEGTNVCLVLVNLKKSNDDLLEELGYWFSFISFHCKELREKCKALIIGSHVDCISGSKTEAKSKVAVVSKFIESFTSKASIEIVKSTNDLIINCRQPRSLTRVHSTLNQILSRAATFNLSEEAAILLGLLEKDFKNVVTCKVQTLLTHIVQTGVCLPRTASSLHPKIMELHTIGLLMMIESMSSKLEDYLLILNVSKLTNEVDKLLFSKDSAKRNALSIDPHSASMGILPQTYLASILPEYITTEFLIRLQYCQEFSHAEVKLDYSVITTEDFCAPRLLYFPALCETERKKNIKTPDNYDYSIGWYIKCCGDFDYFPPRFLHVLLLRLAHTFALPAASEQPSNQSVEERVTATILRLYNHRCTMWKNGIHWLMEEGVECFVENVNNSKGIVIVVKSEPAHTFTCTEMLFKIIQEIHQAKEEFCGTVTLQEYLMDSDNPAAFTNEDILFAACDIARVLQKGKPYVVSTSGRGPAQLKAARISHLIKYVHWGKCKFI